MGECIHDFAMNRWKCEGMKWGIVVCRNNFHPEAELYKTDHLQKNWIEKLANEWIVKKIKKNNITNWETNAQNNDGRNESVEWLIAMLQVWNNLSQVIAKLLL